MLKLVRFRLGWTENAVNCERHYYQLPVITILIISYGIIQCVIFICLDSFDMGNTNVNDPNFDKIKPDNVPDVILVKKVYPDQKQKRRWKLRHFLPTRDTESVTK